MGIWFCNLINLNRHRWSFSEPKQSDLVTMKTKNSSKYSDQGETLRVIINHYVLLPISNFIMSFLIVVESSSKILNPNSAYFPFLRLRLRLLSSKRPYRSAIPSVFRNSCSSASPIKTPKILLSNEALFNDRSMRYRVFN